MQSTFKHSIISGLFVTILVVFAAIQSLLAQEPWIYQPALDISFPPTDSLVNPYLCVTDRHDNLWVISSSAAEPEAKNALYKAAPGDNQFTRVVDYTTDLNIESTRGITAIDDTIYVSARIPGTPMPSLAILYEYPDGEPQRRKDYSGSGYGTWVLGLAANKDHYLYAAISFHTSIRVYDFTESAVSRGAWVPILPIELHPTEPGGHDGTGQSIIRDVAVIPGADYTATSTPFYTSRNSDSTIARGGISVWTGGSQSDPKGYTGLRVTDVAAYLSLLWWTPYGLTADRAGNLYVCGTDTTRRWVKVFSVMGNFALEQEELPAQKSTSNPVPNGAPLQTPADVALTNDEQVAYVIDSEAQKAFVFTRGQVSVSDNKPTQVTSYRLDVNYPNPFNASTTITYEIPRNGQVELQVFDVSGRQVSVLVKDYQEAGRYRIHFDAGELPSGSYFYRLRCGNNSMVRKMVLLR